MLARSPTTGSRVAVVAVAASLCWLVASCGDDGAASADDRARLEASLSFLTAEYQFTSDQVGCVREQLERRVPADAIGGLDDQLRAIDAGILAIDELPTDEAEAVTAAIATCAVSG